MELFSDKTAKNKFTALKEILQKRIEDGVYPVGSKLPSIRSLAGEFHLVIRTIQLALEALEDEGYVVTVPGKGSYVNEHYRAERCKAKVAFVFPEDAISDEILDVENWTSAAQFNNGLLAGAQKYGAEVSVFHIDRRLKEMQQLRWLRKLRKFDTAVFMDRQLIPLQTKLAQEIPVFTPGPLPDPAIPFINYNRFNHRKIISLLVEHAQKCGVQSAGVISLLPKMQSDTYSPADFFCERAKMFIQGCEKSCIKTKESFCLCFDDITKVKEELERAWKEEYPDFVFCNEAYLPKILYQFCIEKGLKIGTDIKIAACASGMTFQGLFPEITYVKTSLFETGVNIIRAVCNSVSEKISVSEIELPEVEFTLLERASTFYCHTKQKKGKKS
ncbi:MAG: GntR family transcriptional regulator [Lentisphaeria bacterium]|nr:GntR family transcriptional regulator [Lentisphaeria bacterium]